MFDRVKMMSIIDYIYRISNPIVVTCVIIFSGIPQYDFTKVELNHPTLTPILYFIKDNSLFYFVVFSVIAMLFAYLDSFIFRPSYKNLKKCNEALLKDLACEKEKNSIFGEQIINILNGFMLGLSHKIGFSDEGTERITLMLYDKNRDSFFSIARYSPNPKYSGPSQRVYYPSTEGVISVGWQDSWCYDNRTNHDDFINYGKQKYGVPKKTLKKIRMHSKIYCAKRIDVNGKGIAILLFESIALSDLYNEKHLKPILNSEEYHIGQLITQISEYIPTPSNAREEGL